jgi:N-acetylmuramoyl-L-alanine amidase
MKLTQDFLSVHPDARPGIVRSVTLALIYHWTGWMPWQTKPGTAKGTRDWFESHEKQSSAQYIIGTRGDILQDIPENEVAWHCGSKTLDPVSGRLYTDWARNMLGEYATNNYLHTPNYATVGIEMHAIDKEGRFSDETLLAALDLGVLICQLHSLDPIRQVGTHHQVVGWKPCPLWWTEHPEQFEKFKQALKGQLSWS